MQPLPLRDEVLPGYEKAMWRPNWKCFCCHDTGIIPDRIVRQEIPNYIAGTHKPVECNASGCEIELGQYLYTTNTLDTRFDRVLCDRLANQEWEMWRDWCKDRYEQRKLKANSQKLIADATKNMRVRERTLQEEWVAQRKHEEFN